MVLKKAQEVGLLKVQSARILRSDEQEAVDPKASPNIGTEWFS